MPRIDGKAWALAWAGALAAGLVNGALRRGYERRLGRERAERLSSVLLLALVLPWARRTERRHPLASGRDAAAVGAGWAAATVAFEFTFGHYGTHTPWAELRAAYDPRRGHWWGLDVLGIAAAPALARRARLRRG